MAKPQAIPPPQNLDAEESVIGAMLLSKHAITAVADLVRPEDFYRRTHGHIFAAILALDHDGIGVDAISLIDYLQRTPGRESHRSLLEEVGGRERIHELAAIVPATANAHHYASIVRETSQLRNLIRAGQTIAKLGFDRPGETSDLIAQAEAALSAVTSQTTGGAVRLNEVIAQQQDDLEELVKSGSTRQGILSGFLRLDNLTAGLHPGQQILIAARPGMGKSLLAQNIAENAADRGHPSAIFSFEMTKEELAHRSLSRATNIPAQKFLTGLLTDQEYATYLERKQMVLDRPLYVDDDASLTVTDLRARAIRLRRKHGIELIVVDYVQLIPPPRIESREQQVSTISRSLKLLAKELHIPIIAISQLNRELENRADKRPQLSDLRESGALEQNADVVLFIYRDDYYNPGSDQQGIAEVIVAKQRMGESGTRTFGFNGQRSSFLNLPDRP